MSNLWYFVEFYAVLLQKVYFFCDLRCFSQIGLLQFTHYCVEKILAKISDRGEKMTNIKYALSQNQKLGRGGILVKFGKKQSNKYHQPLLA